MTISTDRRQDRIVVAAMGKLWAYFAAQARSDWAAASVVLATFQVDWETVRPLALGQLSSDMQLRVDARVPRALSANGQWDANTKTAADFLILAALGGAIYSAVTPLPEFAGGIGSWFSSRLEQHYPRTSTNPIAVLFWSFDAEVRSDDPQNAGLNVNGRAMEFIEDVSVGPAIVNPSTRIVSSTSSATTPADLLEEFTQGSGASFLITSPPDDEDLPPCSPTLTRNCRMADMTVSGQRRDTSPWVLALMGLGAVGAAGLIWWLLAYRKRVQRTA